MLDLDSHALIIRSLYTPFVARISARKRTVEELKTSSQVWLIKLSESFGSGMDTVTEQMGARSNLRLGLTAIVPAYNEEESVADTILALQAQTHAVDEIIIVDDYSTDRTSEIARSLGVKVLRPPANTGSKAGAQNFALLSVATRYCMAVDADTILAPDAVEKIMRAFDETQVVAACGFVVPRYVKSIWERGRYVEYLFAFTFFKPIQDFFGRPMISSGCFSAYDTQVLRSLGGWSTRTMAEDMDLTWTLYERGYSVRFIPDAVCYPIEPHSLSLMSKQLRRWSHGFLQNVRLHWRGLIDQPYLRAAVTVGLWDASVASFAYLFVLPVFTVVEHPLFALGYVIDIPAIAVPVIVEASRRKETGRALASIPCFVVLRLVNAAFMLRALWSEFVMGRTLTVYEKGH